MCHQRIQQYLRSVVEREREAVLADGFVLYVHPRVRHPFLNYAIPAPDAMGGDGRRLVTLARERGLVPRLEYIEPCYRWVEQALGPLGFVREARLRVMTCTPQTLRQPSASVELLEVRPGSPLVGPTISAVRMAFGEPPASEADVAAWRGSAIAARSDGQVVGGAGWTAIIDGMTEIAGVGVLEPARRRGIGGALTIAAAGAAFAEGASLALLTPGDHDTARVYERAGFVDTSTMLHLRAPA